MKIFFHGLLIGLFLFNVPLYTLNGYYNYTLRHHNGFLAQGTNTTKPTNPTFFATYYSGYNFYNSQYQMIIAFTLLKNDGSYGKIIPVI